MAKWVKVSVLSLYTMMMLLIMVLLLFFFSLILCNPLLL